MRISIHQNRPFKLIVAVLCAAFLLPTSPAAGQKSRQPTRVLFIGNSYTYFNNLPEIFRALAEGSHDTVEVQMEAPGGFRLKDHWDKGDALKALHEGRWNYVVLQDQSTLGVTYCVDGKPRVSSDKVFRPYADKWAAEVHKWGSVPVFYLTWAGKDTPEDQPALTYVYTDAAREGQARLAPVGVAWQQVRQRWPSVNLFSEGHGSHPSAEGSYLAACTLYATIFQKSPVGLPARVEGNPVNLESEKVETDKIAVLVDLPPEVAGALQTSAWDTFQEQRKSSGYMKVRRGPVAALPPLPTAARLTPEKLEGTWTGSLLFYPSGPATMTLRLHRSDGWTAHLEIHYSSRDFTDESLDIRDFRMGDKDFKLTDPKSAGVASLSVHFRGILAQDGKLHGTAETFNREQEPPIQLLGSWVLERR